MKPILKTARRKDYKDLDLDFIAHPTTGDVVKKVGADAIKRSVRNLILTNFYERPFRSYIGSNAQKILFDNINPLTATLLKDAIINTLTNFEPRIQVMESEVVVHVDPENNGYIADIKYLIVNHGEPVAISLFLERIR